MLALSGLIERWNSLYQPSMVCGYRLISPREEAAAAVAVTAAAACCWYLVSSTGCWWDCHCLCCCCHRQWQWQNHVADNMSFSKCHNRLKVDGTRNNSKTFPCDILLISLNCFYNVFDCFIIPYKNPITFVIFLWFIWCTSLKILLHLKPTYSDTKYIIYRGFRNTNQFVFFVRLIRVDLCVVFRIIFFQLSSMARTTYSKAYLILTRQIFEMLIKICLYLISVSFMCHSVSFLLKIMRDH